MLRTLVEGAERPRWKGRPFPWVVYYTDRFSTDVRLSQGRDETAVTVDFRFVADKEQRKTADWVRRSDEGVLRDRLVWVAGELGELRSIARELAKSQAMVKHYEQRRAGLPREKQRLLIEEETRREDLSGRLEKALATTFMVGRLYFRGKEIDPTSHGNGFSEAIQRLAERHLPELYPFYTELVISEKEWPQLLERDMTSASTKFFDSGLGILSLDGRRSVPTCAGLVPSRILKFVEENSGVSGNLLVQTFGRPPFGYPVDVLRACLAGLLRGTKIFIQPESGGHRITSHLDPGCKDLFSTDRALRMAEYHPAKVGDVTRRDLTAIRQMFLNRLGQDVDPEAEVLGETGFKMLTDKRAELRQVEAQLERLPGRPSLPKELEAFAKAVDACLADRHIESIVKSLKGNLDRLNDGLEKLGIWRAELTDTAVEVVTSLASCRDVELQQLTKVTDGLDHSTAADEEALTAHLQSPTPWRATHPIEGAAERIRERYKVVRRSLLVSQTRETELARMKIKSRKDFEQLSAAESHEVLRPLAAAPFDTTEDAVAPTLAELVAQFPARLRKAESEANDRLDQLFDKKFKKPVKSVRLTVHGREVETRTQLKSVLQEIENELGPLVDQGVRVRIQ